MTGIDNDMRWRSRPVGESRGGGPGFTVGAPLTGKMGPGGKFMGAPKFYDTCPVPQATASPIEIKLAVKVCQYLFSPVNFKLCNACTRLDKINAQNIDCKC